MTTLIAITDSLSILRKEQMIIRFVSCYSADNSWLLLTSRNISSSCAAWGLIHTGRQCRIRHGRPCRKDVRHSRDKNHPLSTKVNRVERIKFADNVERDKLSNPSLSPVCTDERQSRNDVTRDTLSFDTCSTSNKPATVDFRQNSDKSATNSKVNNLVDFRLGRRCRIRLCCHCLSDTASRLAH